MCGAIPVLNYDAAPGETITLPDLSPYHGLLFVFMSVSGGLQGAGLEQSITLTIPRITSAYRREHWQAAFADYPAELDAISERFLLPGATIRQIARIAVTQARLDGKQPISVAHVQAACRAVNQQELGSLADYVEAQGNWHDLIVDDVTLLKLQELAQRCRYRETLLNYLTPLAGKQSNTGVRALFAGPSGTGKTLAATILAAELKMDLFRVDLASVVNKYIGETEKNLHKVLSKAEELDVILLLDEGDALLGNRTEVKSANDRYANLETNFLLQRLERYHGIVIITTNLESAIDTAFQRRIDVLARFELPNAAQRTRIWQAHLPANHRIDEATLHQITARCKLSGGQIRNAAHYATLLSLGHGGHITTHDLERAVQEEYRKLGALSPLNGQQLLLDAHGGMKAFLDSFS